MGSVGELWAGLACFETPEQEMLQHAASAAHGKAADGKQRPGKRGNGEFSAVFASFEGWQMAVLNARKGKAMARPRAVSKGLANGETASYGQF